MKPGLIITHPGSAHFDDFTAVSLVLATNPGQDFRLERREAAREELEDPQVWVIDTGGRHEPAKRNFDHHQTLDCPASFVLIADYLGLLDTLSVMPWWRFKDSVDRIGPVKSSQLFQAGDDLVNRNPIESWLVDKFAGDPQGSLPLLRSYGEYLIADARGLKSRIEFWKTAPRLTIAGIPAMIGETMESAGLEEYRRLAEAPADIVISLDRSGKGWRLYRYDGVPVDFTLIAGSPKIEFAHKSGFMAKTREKLPLEDLIALISRAVVKF